MKAYLQFCYIRLLTGLGFIPLALDVYIWARQIGSLYNWEEKLPFSMFYRHLELYDWHRPEGLHPVLCVSFQWFWKKSWQLPQMWMHKVMWDFVLLLLFAISRHCCIALHTLSLVRIVSFRFFEDYSWRCSSCWLFLPCSKLLLEKSSYFFLPS